MNAQTKWPGQQTATFTITDFRFANGQVLPELRQGYITLGEPRRNADGAIVNGVLLIHNTTGTAESWLAPSLANELFGPGQPLDAARYYIVIPDCIGFGRTSKPSDGARARFPNYRYGDMVSAQHRLLTEGLGLTRVRLVLGLSMGGMLTWMWGQTHPDFMDALVPIASQPGPMSGRNWIQRRISIEAIRNDPEWNGGDYDKNPSRYVFTAPFGALMTESVVRLQEMAPTREAADALYQQFVERARKGDANDRLYQVEASMDYDPSPGLDTIRARLLAINFIDDQLNPPELGTVEAAIARIPRAGYVLVPAGPNAHGHYTSLQAVAWSSYLGDFLAVLSPPA